MSVNQYSIFRSNFKDCFDYMSIDHKSDINPVYLEFESSGDEYVTTDFNNLVPIQLNSARKQKNSYCVNFSGLDGVQTTASSIDHEESEIDPKDVYMVIVSEEKTSSDAGFHCEVCNSKFSTTDEVNKHLSTHKPDINKKCEICNNVMDINLYDTHMKLHKEAYKQRKENNKAQCKKCGKIVGKTYLKFHMKMHGSQKDKIERMKQCPICDKLVSYYYFNGHMKRIHDKSHKTTDASEQKTKTCPICDRTFKENYFEKHVSSHGHHQKHYICDRCGRVFKHYSAFQTHLLIHKGDLKYKCQFCPYRGLHLGLLKVHVRTHTKDYLYECTICNKKFLTKSNLSVHERCHKTSSSFVCPECNRGFSAQRNLDKHFSLIHLRLRNEKCEICGKAFGHRDGLLAHQIKVHDRKKNTYKGRLPSYLKDK